MSRNTVFLILTAVILISSGSYIFACHCSLFAVSEIKVEGNDKIASCEIMEKADSCIGANIVSVSLKRIREKLREDIRINDVQLKKRLPRRILIRVEEKRPVLWIKLPSELKNLGSCGFCGLSVDQEIIPLDQEDLSNDLPIVTGIQIGSPWQGESQPPLPYRRWSNLKVEKALEFYKTIRATDPASVRLLAEINLKDISDMVLYLLPRIKVMMGDVNYERKWRRVRTVLEAEGKVADLVSLDLRFDDQLVLARSSNTLRSLTH